MSTEDMKAYKKAYYLDHKEVMLAQQRVWRSLHEGYDKVYQQENREVLWANRQTHLSEKKIYDARFRSAKRGADSPLWNFRLAALQADTCMACGFDGPLTFDHIIPIAQGGTSDFYNLQMLCAPCNRAKGTQSTDYRQKAAA